MSQEHGCEVSFTPYVRPGITATGGVNAVVAKGGVYARGTVANTYLEFYTNIAGFIRKLSGTARCSISIKPFEFQIGAWYRTRHNKGSPPPRRKAEGAPSFVS